MRSSIELITNLGIRPNEEGQKYKNESKQTSNVRESVINFAMNSGD